MVPSYLLDSTAASTLATSPATNGSTPVGLPISPLNTATGPMPPVNLARPTLGEAPLERLFGPGGNVGYHLPVAALQGDQVWSDTFPQPYVGPLSIDNWGCAGPIETWEMRRQYRELYRKEPSVRSAINGKASDVAGLDITVLPQDRQRENDVKAAEYVKWAVENTLEGWGGLIRQIVTPSLIDGYSVLEKTMMVVEPEWGAKWAGFYGLKHCRSLDTMWIRLQLDQYRNVLNVVNTIRGLQYYSPDKFILFSYMSLWSNPFGQSDLRACIRACNLIQDAYQLWYLALKMFGLPYLHGQVSVPAQRAAMETALEQLRAGGFCVTGIEDRIELLSLAGASSFTAFEAQVNKMREDNFLAIRGAYLPFLEGTGSADSRGDTRINKIASDSNADLLAQSVARVLSHQLVPWLVKDNFPKGTGYPIIAIGGTDWDDTSKRLDVALTLAKEFGLELSKDQLYRWGSWSPPDGPDDAVSINKIEAQQQLMQGKIQLKLQAEGQQQQMAMQAQMQAAQGPPPGAGGGGAPPAGGGQPPQGPPPGGGGGQPAPQGGGGQPQFELGPAQQFSDRVRMFAESVVKPRAHEMNSNEARSMLDSAMTRPQLHHVEHLLRDIWPDYTETRIPDMGNDYAYAAWRAANRGDEIPRFDFTDFHSRHRAAVRRALESGLHVPSRVLEDHPGLVGGDMEREGRRPHDEGGQVTPARFAEIADRVLGSLGGVRGFADKHEPEPDTGGGADPKTERARLKAAIDADPDDAGAHNDYAEWLEGHGHHDEATFHRTMAYRTAPGTVPEALDLDDVAEHVPTATPADDGDKPDIPELADREPTHNEQIAIAGQPVYVGSTNVSNTWYNWRAKRLFVRFLDGSLYAYDGVSLPVATGMIQTDSPGRYVWNTLRADGYAYRRLERGASRKGKGKPKAQVIRKHSDGDATPAAQRVFDTPLRDLPTRKQTEAAHLNTYRGGSVSSRTTPSNGGDSHGVPVGGWRAEGEWCGPHGHDVEQLREFDPHSLEIPEGDWTKGNSEGRGDDAHRYAEWLRDGNVPPPISVIQTENGRFRVVDGHRRTAAAKLAGVQVKAWVSPVMEIGVRDSEGRPIKVGATYEGLVGQSLYRGEPVAEHARQTYAAWLKGDAAKAIKDLTHLESLYPGKYTSRIAQENARLDYARKLSEGSHSVPPPVQFRADFVEPETFADPNAWKQLDRHPDTGRWHKPGTLTETKPTPEKFAGAPTPAPAPAPGPASPEAKPTVLGKPVRGTKPHRYEATNASGENVSGVIHANNEGHAAGLLQGHGLTPTSVTQAHANSPTSWLGRSFDKLMGLQTPPVRAKVKKQYEPAAYVPFAPNPGSGVSPSPGLPGPTTTKSAAGWTASPGLPARNIQLPARPKWSPPVDGGEPEPTPLYPVSPPAAAPAAPAAPAAAPTGEATASSATPVPPATGPSAAEPPAASAAPSAAPPARPPVPKIAPGLSPDFRRPGTEPAGSGSPPATPVAPPVAQPAASAGTPAPGSPTPAATPPASAPVAPVQPALTGAARFPAKPPVAARKDLKERWKEFTSDPDVDNRVHNHPAGEANGGFNRSGHRFPDTAPAAQIITSGGPEQQASKKAGYKADVLSSTPFKNAVLNATASGDRKYIVLTPELVKKIEAATRQRVDPQVIGSTIRMTANADHMGRQAATHVFPPGVQPNDPAAPAAQGGGPKPLQNAPAQPANPPIAAMQSRNAQPAVPAAPSTPSPAPAAPTSSPTPASSASQPSPTAPPGATAAGVAPAASAAPSTAPPATAASPSSAAPATPSPTAGTPATPPAAPKPQISPEAHAQHSQVIAAHAAKIQKGVQDFAKLGADPTMAKYNIEAAMRFLLQNPDKPSVTVTLKKPNGRTVLATLNRKGTPRGPGRASFSEHGQSVELFSLEFEADTTPAWIAARRDFSDQDDENSFHEQINAGELTPRKVYADYLDEHPGRAEPWVVHLLRHHNGELTVRHGNDGRPTLNFVKHVDPGVIGRKGMPTQVSYNDGRLSITGRSGQTIMGFRQYDPRGHLSIQDVKPRPNWTPKMVRQFHDIWDRWHLNDMRPGSPAQEEYIRERQKSDPGFRVVGYQTRRDELANRGLNPDPKTGYDYGSSWNTEQVPSDVLHFLATLPDPYVPKQRKMFAADSTDLKALFRAARENPHEITGHAVIADALDEAHPGNKIGDLIREQFGVGAHGGKGEKNNLYYEPVENSWDGTFPYTARLGRHGPFNLYLGHKWNRGRTAHGNPRWILHAVSRLPGSDDFGYTFEFPHEEAHRIPQMFQAASNHIARDIDEDPESAYHPDNDPVAHDVERNREASEFDDRMDEEERNRT